MRLVVESSCENLDSHMAAGEDSSVVGHHAASSGKYLPKFRRIVMPS
jgi:hypothetical protein